MTKYKMTKHKMMNKKTAALLMTGCILFLTGCGDAIPEMSEKQADMMTEYAAGTLLDHTSASTSRLVDTSVEYNPDKMTKYEKEKLGIATPDPEPAPEATEETPAPEETDGAGGDDTASAPAPEPAMTATEVIGCDGVEIEMRGFSVLDSYPEPGTADTFFSMDATQGNQLVVARLLVKNTGSEKVEMNLAPRTDLHFNLLINGQTSQNALLTMLSDDFSTMTETLEPGQEFPCVLISQVSTDLSASITSLSVEIRSDLGKAVLSSTNQVAGGGAAAVAADSGSETEENPEEGDTGNEAQGGDAESSGAQ